MKYYLVHTLVIHMLILNTESSHPHMKMIIIVCYLIIKSYGRILIYQIFIFADICVFIIDGLEL